MIIDQDKIIPKSIQDLNETVLKRAFMRRIYETNLPLRYHTADMDIVKKVGINPLESAYIWGPPGGGKTYLVGGIIRTIIERDLLVQFRERNYQRSKIAYFSIPILMSHIRHLFNKDHQSKIIMDDEITPRVVNSIFPFSNELDLLKWIHDIHYLFLDDLGAERYTSFAEEILFMIVNQRYENMEHLCVCSNLSVHGMGNHLHDHIASRLSDSQVTFLGFLGGTGGIDEKTGSGK